MSSVNDPQESLVSGQPRNEPRDEASGKPTPPAEQRELQVEELEERIAPKLAANHNETVLT